MHVGGAAEHQNVLQVYVFLNNRKEMFEVIDTLEKGYAAQSQQTCRAVDNFVVEQGMMEMEWWSWMILTELARCMRR